MEKIKNILKGAVVLLISTAMVFTSIGVLADTYTIQILPSDTLIKNNNKNRQNIVWDNDMSYLGLIRAQYDSNIPLDCYPADDFHFTEDTQVNDVHWVGGYWFGDYQQGDFDWIIKFYEDRGDGNAPGSVYEGPYQFSWNQISKTFLQDTGIMILYELSIDLPQNIQFEGCKKYWISIWGVGFEPPNSGWGFHYDPILLRKAMVQSFYFFEDNEWHGAEGLTYDPSDLCFQLTYTENEKPTPPDIDGPSSGKAGEEYCWIFHSDDPEGDMVRYYINWGDGTENITDWFKPCVPVTICHTFEKYGTYIITAKAEDESGLVSDESTFEVTIPRSRTFQNTLLLQLFEWFPNLVPILQQLLGLI